MSSITISNKTYSAKTTGRKCQTPSNTHQKYDCIIAKC